ncbi:hypothetical protein PR202_ga05900 [Eleusine coracana subsp. coracana]|uniref:F-box associated beta-propeller type 1 domain-containing protein n=1 Tax=Eleusine coracana subsp. coracana TaxID=191504 RepID=A0AAV5BVW0_ELECO|nr:hypothetical protein PR202_ga05900 [Eleusine coracana subsp. coracana]
MLVGKGIRGSDFTFVPLKEMLQCSPNCATWLDTKVVCSKPCHGLNLLSTETKDYLYNPCTGYRYVNQTRGLFSDELWNVPGYGFKRDQDHAFAVGKKIVGLGFNLLMQEHVIVEIFYHQKDLESHKYSWTCSISTINRSFLQTSLLPQLPVNDMPPAYLSGILYWMSEPRLGRNSERAIVSFDIALEQFDVVPCPSCIASWNNKNHCPAFVVEPEERLCAVLANPVAEKLDIWKLEDGRWDRAYKIYLKGTIVHGSHLQSSSRSSMTVHLLYLGTVSRKNAAELTTCRGNPPSRTSTVGLGVAGGDRLDGACGMAQEGIVDVEGELVKRLGRRPRGASPSEAAGVLIEDARNVEEA